MRSDVAAVILAGGDGIRIGGSKPLKRLAGQRLIDHSLEQARRWSATVAIGVREDSQVPGVGAVLIRDALQVEGPLAGLISGLAFAHDSGCELLLTIPSDMPFLPNDLLDRLRDAIGDVGAALASSGGHVHPVCGLWRASSRDCISDYLASGRRSLKGFAEMVGWVAVEWSTARTDPFFNVNCAEDLAEAARRLGS
jgi:molybdopterin-guanine dinucleotide biosynthesis protein A